MLNSDKPTIQTILIGMNTINKTIDLSSFVSTEKSRLCFVGIQSDMAVAALESSYLISIGRNSLTILAKAEGTVKATISGCNIVLSGTTGYSYGQYATVIVL